MKIRTDFVTNSSSSSFVILTTRENYYEVMEDMHPAYQALAEQMFSKTLVFGQHCMVASTMETHGGSWDEWFSLDYDGEYPDGMDEDDFIWRGWDKICAAIQENDEATFTHSASM